MGQERVCVRFSGTWKKISDQIPVLWNTEITFSLMWGALPQEAVVHHFSPLCSSLVKHYPRHGLTQYYVKKDQIVTVTFCSKYPFYHTFTQQLYFPSQISMWEDQVMGFFFCLKPGFFWESMRITDSEAY